MSGRKADKLLLVNAGELVTLRGPEAPRAGRWAAEPSVIRGGAVLMEGEWIVAAGRYRDLRPLARGARVIDAGGRVVLPGFVDSHTHPVFTEPRLQDFSRRLAGLDYTEIARRGGGILSTVRAVRRASLSELVEGLHRRAHGFLACGTTTIEAKSGYGLDLASEIRMLEAIRIVGETGPLDIVPTVLAAHAVPPEARNASRYAEIAARSIVPEAARRGLAVFADAFCELGYCGPRDTEKVLRAGLRAGLKVKVHAEQLTRSGGARLAARLRAVTADHLDHASASDIAALRRAGVIAGLVPGSNYFLGKPYPPARKMIEAGLPVALATDFNPGTCPCWNMQAILSIACSQMQLAPEEALVAATINGAFAVGLGGRVGSIEAGKQADLAVFEAADHRELSYWFGANLCMLTIKAGRVAYERK